MIQCVSEKKTLTVNAHSERKQRPDNGAAANVSTPGSALTSASASLLMKVAGLSHSECVQDVPSPGRIFWNNGLESLMHELHFPPSLPPFLSYSSFFLFTKTLGSLSLCVCVYSPSPLFACLLKAVFNKDPVLLMLTNTIPPACVPSNSCTTLFLFFPLFNDSHISSTCRVLPREPTLLPVLHPSRMSEPRTARRS